MPPLVYLTFAFVAGYLLGRAGSGDRAAGVLDRVGKMSGALGSMDGLQLKTSEEGTTTELTIKARSAGPKPLDWELA